MSPITATTLDLSVDVLLSTIARHQKSIVQSKLQPTERVPSPQKIGIPDSVGIANILTTEARVKRAYELYKQGPEHIESAILTLDPEFDRKNPLALLVWAWCYMHPFNQHCFKPDLALALLLVADQTLGKDCATWIAELYASGATGRIDVHAAIHWYEIAIERGDAQMKGPLAKLYKTHDQRYGSQEHREFNTYVRSLETSFLEALTTEGDHLEAARLYAAGKVVARDDQRASVHYDQAISLDAEHRFSGAQALIARVARHFLGIGPDADTRTSHILSLMSSYSGENSYCAGMRNQTQRLFNYVSLALKEFDGAPEYGASVRNFLKSVDSGQTSLDKAVEIIRQRNKINDGIAYSIWVMSILAAHEGRDTHTAWRRLCAEAMVRRNGLDWGDVERSTMEWGPNYNILDEAGLPVLGAFGEPARDVENELHQKVTRGFYTPQSGIARVLEVRATERLGVHFDHSNSRPALLTDEDIDVVSALMFGASEPIWPSFSLEEAGTEIDEPFQLLKIKVWNEPWLGSTDFGRTLYVTDALTGALGWHSQNFAVDSGVSQRSGVARQLLVDLQTSGGQCAGHCGGRVMLRPEHVPVTVARRFLVAGWTASVGKATIWVDGAFIEKKTYDTEGDRSVALNDTRYRYGRTASLLSKHYDAIADMIPVFERYRQMMGLLYGTYGLRRERRFQPRASFKARSRALLERFRARNASMNQLSKRVCRSLDGFGG